MKKKNAFRIALKKLTNQKQNKTKNKNKNKTKQKA